MPDPIDVHVGQKFRARRKELGFSQQHVADFLNMTFQQIQKYERGSNRISASVLWKSCELMRCDPNYFFDGLVNPKATKMEQSQAAAKSLFEQVVAHGGMKLLQNFVKLSRTRRTALLKIASVLTVEEDRETTS